MAILFAEQSRREARKTPRTHSSERHTGVNDTSYVRRGQLRRYRSQTRLADVVKRARWPGKRHNKGSPWMRGTALCAETVMPAAEISQVMILAVAFRLLAVLGEFIWVR